MTETEHTTEESKNNMAVEIQAMIAEKVREESKNMAKLTSIGPLTTLAPDLKLDGIKASLLEMAKSDDYMDIKSIVAPNNAMYLYSEASITKEYATILARVEANDMCSTIALTVREESRIYPRLTSVEFFVQPLFNVVSDELEAYITRTMEREEFKDLKLMIASTGARYLYSDLYINEEYARALAEWEEVEQFENP